MYKEILKNIEGVSIYPIVSLLIFFVIFVVMLVYVITLKKNTIDEISALPFDKKYNHEI